MIDQTNLQKPAYIAINLDTRHVDCICTVSALNSIADLDEDTYVLDRVTLKQAQQMLDKPLPEGWML